jgi:hypothetical protein
LAEGKAPHLWSALEVIGNKVQDFIADDENLGLEV